MMMMMMIMMAMNFVRYSKVSAFQVTILLRHDAIFIRVFLYKYQISEEIYASLFRIIHN
jgi:hypothetical protein